jgi:hypothetical protein
VRPARTLDLAASAIELPPTAAGRSIQPVTKRDFLAFYAEGGNVISIGITCEGDRARSAHAEDEAEGEVLSIPPLTSDLDEESSGGETRTLNLAVNSRSLCH